MNRRRGGWFVSTHWRDLGSATGEVGRCGVYLLGALFTAVVTMLALPLLCFPGVARQWADWHRSRAGRLIGVPVAPRPTPARGSMRRGLANPSVRRDLGWLFVHVATGAPFGLVALLCMGNVLLAAVATPLWWVFPADARPRLLIEVAVTDWGTALTLGLLQVLLLVALAYWVFPLLAGAHARICLAVLTASAAEQLAHRVAVLTRTRADALDAHGAELRRIERDLHDGTQARLVAIAVRLAVAREALPDKPQVVEKLLQEAHEGTEEAMTELREVIRTIYPPILADRGLVGALTTMAASCGVPTKLDIGDLGRIPAAVEAVAYFVVAEALTNVAKHSHASQAAVRVDRTGDRLSITVSDDGIGGADETLGTGLVGIRRRALALDGSVTVTSPAGGPTALTVELPCGW